MKKWLLLSMALYSANALAFPRENPVPGGIAHVTIAPLSNTAPIVQYAGQRVTVVPVASQWVALVGIPLDVEEGTQQLNTASGERIAFEIQPKQYKTQHITIRDKNKVDPDDESSERIVRELAVQ
ncbi:MAG: hypothetical protein RL122_2732, partial [Pseudomonadota bacterium]